MRSFPRERRAPSKAPLLGKWQSDRHRTLEYWSFPKNVSERTRRLLRSKEFFGHLRFRITARRFTTIYKGKSWSQMYRIVFHDAHRVIVAFGKGRNSEFRDLHFDGPDCFYMLAGKANCEFFKRI